MLFNKVGIIEWVWDIEKEKCNEWKKVVSGESNSMESYACQKTTNWETWQKVYVNFSRFCCWCWTGNKCPLWMVLNAKLMAIASNSPSFQASFQLLLHKTLFVVTPGHFSPFSPSSVLNTAYYLPNNSNFIGSVTIKIAYFPIFLFYPLSFLLLSNFYYFHLNFIHYFQFLLLPI